MKQITYLLMCLSVLVTACTKNEQPKPPIAKVNPVNDTLWGKVVTDPYRYMENLDDPYVKKWIKEQADYTDSILTNLPARQKLLDRLLELDAGTPFETWDYVFLKDGTLFYQKQSAEDNLSKIYLRESTGKDKLLIDPEQVKAEEGEHYALWDYSPSSDGRFVVYGLAKSGSEETVLHILNVETGDYLPETIDRLEIAYNKPQWLPDGSGFFYSRRQLLPDDAPETEIYKKTKVYFHRLNTPVEQDQVIAGTGLSGRIDFSEVDFPSIGLKSGSDHAILKIKHGDANELSLYTAPIKTLLQQNIPWKKVCDIEHEVTGFTVHGDDIFMMSAKNAPRFKVIQTSLINPDILEAKTVVQESEAVIDNVSASSKALFISLIDGGLDRIICLDFNKMDKPLKLELPDNAFGYMISASPEREQVLIRTSSWTKGSVVYLFHMDANRYEETDLLPKGKFDNMDGYESVEVKVKSHDGVMVPLSIIYKSGIELNGRNPALISGYGSYGIIEYVYFNPLNIAWLERGGILAIAHVRGGGEYGKEWHMAGQKANKPNTWKDFIACAEYLIKEGYTSHDLIAGQGGSAGGITIGRAITERPDLFKAAIINVGCLDAIRFETTTNGVPNIPEFGTVKIEEEFKGLLAMSAYHHVQDGIKYPAVLLTVGMNDPRVDPWASAKMTARLQAATRSSNPVLLKVEYNAGHGIGSTRTQYLNNIADEWAFLLWQFGIE